ncbi:phosphomethylpyrimidine synthase ThiC, partial [Streptomyces sp. NPDC057074]
MTIKDARTPASTQNSSLEETAEAGKSIGWHKAYVEGSRPDLRVPVRQVHLTNGQSVTLYDTSGPYT